LFAIQAAGWLKPRSFLTCLVATILLSGNAIAEPFHSGEHLRRAGAELQVLYGDVRLLRQPKLHQAHKTGLIDRIQGSLTALDILLRMADQEMGREVMSRLSETTSLKHSMASREYEQVENTLSVLLEQYPLRIPVMVVTDTTEALAIHKSLCQSCHTTTLGNVERPAYNLFEQTRSIPRVEMFDRMLIGVRGDRVTGIDNPLTDFQIMAMITLYSDGASDNY